VSVLTLLGAGLTFMAFVQSTAWIDPAPHRVQLIPVTDGVQLEVLDFGGTGRPIVLLAGLGNTAHVFDDLAPKLAENGCCHVYGITRRGFGASTRPERGYENQRLADDIIAVLDALHLTSPVLIGHSMAGGEITTIGHQHSDRIGGLVYLDALGDPRDWPASDPAWRALMQKLPPGMGQQSSSCGSQSSTFDGYRVWQRCREHFAFPESELRNDHATNPNGSMGEYTGSNQALRLIGDGEVKRDYTNIRVPVLAFLELPRPVDIKYLRDDEYHPKNDEERDAMLAFGGATKAFMDRWISNLTEHVPQATLVNLPGSGHYVFLTRETEVLTGIRAFIAKLP